MSPFPLLCAFVLWALTMPLLSSRAAPEKLIITPDFPGVPGVVIDHLAASTHQYIGSPSIAILPAGTYVASHDIFGAGSSKDQILIFGSSNRGQSWTKLAQVKGHWSNLFVHRGALYLMGTDREYGHLIIRRSRDGGRSWTNPTDARNGLLFADGPYHTAPVPMVEHNGRLWRAFEDAQGPGGWGHHFRSFVMSAPIDADLLRASSWMSSNRLARDETWLHGRFGGWLEGNVVAMRDGRIVNILRTDARPDDDRAALISISADGKIVTFNPLTDFIRLPGAGKKFTIRYDARSKLFWSLTNWVLPRDVTGNGGNRERSRNTLALIASPDMRAWSVRSIVLYHPDTAHHAFQYADWLFDGDDLIVVSRTAFDDGVGGAANNHDANFLTFHRIADFRTRSWSDAPSAIRAEEWKEAQDEARKSWPIGNTQTEKALNR